MQSSTNATHLPLHAAAAEHQPATNAEHTLTNAKQQQLQPATAQEGNTKQVVRSSVPCHGNTTTQEGNTTFM